MMFTTKKRSGQTEISVWKGVRNDTTWQISDRVTRIGFGFLLNVVTARMLGPSTFGIYSYALAITALFSFLGQAGIDALLLRELIRHPEKSKTTISESLVLRLAGTLLAGIASIATAVIASTSELKPATLLVVILSLSGIFQAGWVIESLLQARKQFRYAALAKITAYTIASLMRLAALILPHPLWGLAIAAVLESAIAATLMWNVSSRRISFDISQLAYPSLTGLLALTKLASPMLLSAFTVAIYSRIDVFMLGHMLGGNAAGLYTVATLLSEGFYVFPMAIMSAVAPRLTTLHAQPSNDLFTDGIYSTIRLLSVVGLGVAIGTSLIAPFIITRIFGPEYGPAATILKIHIWSTWAVFVSSASDPWYINNDLRNLYFFKNAFAAALNIALNFVLIPKLGGNGAAFATVIAYTSSALFFGFFSKSTRPLFFMQIRAVAGLPRSIGKTQGF